MATAAVALSTLCRPGTCRRNGPGCGRGRRPGSERSNPGRWRSSGSQAVVGLRRDAIREHAPVRAGQNRSQLRIVDAGGDRAIERHLVHEGQEGALHIVHVAVAVHVFAVEIGDHGEDGRELEEGAVALVGLRNQVLRGAETRIGAHGVDAAANDHCRIEASRAEHARDHRGRGGLSVHTGDGDAVLEAHEFSQHLGALNDGNLASAGLDHFRIGSPHGGAGNNHRRARDVAGFMALVDDGAKLREPIRDRAAAQVGAGDLHPLVEKDLGDAAHADAADANEVCVLRSGEHLDSKG